MFRVGLISLVVLMVAGCGTSKSYVSANLKKQETWQICKSLLQDEYLGYRKRWQVEELKSRGENCEKYIGKFQPKQPSQDAGTALIQSLGKALQQHNQQQPQYYPAPTSNPNEARGFLQRNYVDGMN